MSAKKQKVKTAPSFPQVIKARDVPKSIRRSVFASRGFVPPLRLPAGSKPLSAALKNVVLPSSATPLPNAPSGTANFENHAQDMKQRGLGSMGGALPWQYGDDMVSASTQEAMDCVLSPWDGYQRNLLAKVPDGSMKATYSWWTKQTITFGTHLNPLTNSNDCWVAMLPCSVINVIEAATFSSAGVPATFNQIPDPSNGAQAGTVYQRRTVAMGMEVRNVTEVLGQGGTALQGRFTFADIDAIGTGTFSSLTSYQDTCVRGLGNPGDVGLLAWYPKIGGVSSDDLLTNDWCWGSYNSPLTPNDTALLFWAQTPVGSSLTQFAVTFYHLHEAVILAAFGSFVPSNIRPGDISLATRIFITAMARLPATALGRMVCRDDGTPQEVISDLQSIFGSVKNVVSKGSGLINSAWSALKGLFGAAGQPTSDEEIVMRLLNLRIPMRIFKSIVDLQDRYPDPDDLQDCVSQMVAVSRRRSSIMRHLGGDADEVRDALLADHLKASVSKSRRRGLSVASIDSDFKDPTANLLTHIIVDQDGDVPMAASSLKNPLPPVVRQTCPLFGPGHSCVISCYTSAGKPK